MKYTLYYNLNPKSDNLWSTSDYTLFFPHLEVEASDLTDTVLPFFLDMNLARVYPHLTIAVVPVEFDFAYYPAVSISEGFVKSKAVIIWTRYNFDQPVDLGFPF